MKEKVFWSETFRRKLGRMGAPFTAMVALFSLSSGCCPTTAHPAAEATTTADRAAGSGADVETTAAPGSRCLPVVTTCDENLPCERIERNSAGQWALVRNGTVVTVESRCVGENCVDAAIFPVPSGCGGESESSLILDCRFEGDACVGGP